MKKPAYLIYGENEFEVKRKLGEIEKEGDYTITYVEDGYTFEDVIQLLNAPSLFMGNILYVVKDESILNDSEGLTALKAYIDDPAEFSCLALVFSKKVDSRKKVVKFFKENGLIFEFPLRKGRDLEAFIKQYFWEKGYDIDIQAIYFLIASIGDNQLLLESEMEKIILYSPENKKLTEGDIRPIVSHYIQGNIFKLLDGMMDKKADMMIEALENLYKLKEPEVRILFMVIREYRLTLLCKWGIKEGWGSDRIIKELKVHPFVGKQLIRRGKKFSFKELIYSMKYLYGLEEKMKTGEGDPKVLLESTLLGLV